MIAADTLLGAVHLRRLAGVSKDILDRTPKIAPVGEMGFSFGHRGGRSWEELLQLFTLKPRRLEQTDRLALLRNYQGAKEIDRPDRRGLVFLCDCGGQMQRPFDSGGEIEAHRRLNFDLLASPPGVDE